ncbi:type IV pilin protein [Candidatus Avelusimicrobium caledoniensis]|uniref:type IV pilin protein n=1 Tax=Candidatus Avelusimicrobium caledoniensis TaxID=3416220 RepID=UPI003D0AFF84
MEKKRCLKENKKGRHAELDSASHLVSVLESGEIPYQVRNDNIFYCGGFTLIELLVVVLIIGILASVALPQYKMAVAKSRVSGLLTTVKSVLQAEETYYLANGQYTANWDELALDVPGTPNPTHKQIKEFPNGYIGLGASGSVYAVSSQVQGVRLYFFHEHGSIALSFRGKTSCYAKMGNDFANKVCQALTHKKTPSSNNGPGTDNIYHF